MATISLCMIVKNEEKVLARCLDSVKPAVDEIVILDTGSTDATKDVAARYTDRIYDFPWVDDFSAARNASFAKASMTFTMWLDADDVLLPEDLEALIQLKSQLDTLDADVIMLPYHTGVDETGAPSCRFFRERLLRTGIPLTWKGRVHEAIQHQGRSLRLEKPAITHRSIKTVYTDRNLRIYQAQAAAGEPFSPRDSFYYGRELYYHKRYQEAIKVLEDFLRSGRGWVENNVEACKILSYCYEGLEDDMGAFGALTSSFFFTPPRAELCCELGRLFMKLRLYPNAIFWYELALTCSPADREGAFMNRDCYGYLPCIQLCVCYDALGDHKTAEAYNRRAGGYKSTAAYQHNLAYFAALAQHQEAPPRI